MPYMENPPEIHNVKMKYDEQGKGEVWLDDKPLITTGTEIKTGTALGGTHESTIPQITIHTIPNLLDFETDGVVTIVPVNWMETLKEREQQEIKFAKEYASAYGHGTDGHHRLNVIAKLAWLLDELTGQTK